MSALDLKRRDKAKSSFKPHGFKGPDDARTYLSHLSGTKGGGIGEHVASGTLGRATEALRAGKRDVPEMHQIDATMKPLPDGLDLYRSVPAGKFGKVDPKSLEGHLVSDAGYFPTTVAPTKAAPGSIQLHIQTPAGTHAATDPDTGQVVLNHGTQMAVESVETGPDGSTRMDLVALPDEAAPDGDGAPAEPSVPAEQAPPPAPARTGLTGEAALNSAPRSLVRRDTFLFDTDAESLIGYRASDYPGINSRLRSGRTDATDRVDRRLASAILDIDTVMGESRLPHDVELYRGVDAQAMFGDRLAGDLSGMEWREDAYVSATADEAVANGFAVGSHNAVVMRLIVPAGTGGVEMSDASYESEMLLQRGLRLRVATDRGVDEHGIRRLDVEVVPGG